MSISRKEYAEVRTKAIEDAVAVCVAAIEEDPSCFRTVSYVMERIRVLAEDVRVLEVSSVDEEIVRLTRENQILRDQIVNISEQIEEMVERARSRAKRDS